MLTPEEIYEEACITTESPRQAALKGIRLAVREAVEEACKTAQETETCELREIGRGGLRRFSGKRVKEDIVENIRYHFKDYLK